MADASTGRVVAVVAALPIALNWTMVSRRLEPEASMPREFARALLDPRGKLMSIEDCIGRGEHLLLFFLSQSHQFLFE